MKKLFLIFIFVVLLSLNVSASGTITTFNDSITAANISIGKSLITKYFNIPSNYYATSAYINFTGINNSRLAPNVTYLSNPRLQADGYTINVKNNFTLYYAEKDGTCNATIAVLLNSSRGKIMESSFTGNYAYFNYNLTAGRNYSVVVWSNESTTYLLRYDDDVDSPYPMHTDPFSYVSGVTGWNNTDAGSSISNRGYNVLALGIRNNFPYGIAVNITSNYIYNKTAALTSTEKSIDFKTLLNNYVSTCTLISGNCRVPVTFRAAENTMIEYSAITVNYDDYSFNLCNATINYSFINFTFKDESNLSDIGASIFGSTVDYTFSGTNISDSFTITNTSQLTSRAFCSNIESDTVTVDFVIEYDATSYPQRIYQARHVLTSTTTNKVLYLLSSSDGIYVTFQVINAAEQPLEDVYVQINKSISGTQEIIGSGYTGADGGITFWLNPDDQYTVFAYLSPYSAYSTTQAFTQDSYTINLGSSVTANASDYNKGITYTIAPTGTHLTNGTFYSFNFTITSTYWALDKFGINITNQNGVLLGNITNLSGTTGGKVTRSIFTGENTTLRFTYFWTINNETSYASRNYRVLDLSSNDYSIKKWFTDFDTYVDSADGLFGITEFGVGLIVFFIIVGTVGTARVKFGLNDEATLTGILFALVLFFDVSVGLLPNPVGAIPHFPSVLMGIIFIGFAFKEVFQ